jgi:two-component system response regulator RegA
MIAPTLLIVEDDQRLRDSIAIEFTDKGYAVSTADSLKNIEAKIYEYAIVDMRLNGTSGLNVVEHLKLISPNCRIVILTGYGSISTAVEAIKLGAINYLTKPADIDKIEQALLGHNVENAKQEQPITLSQQEHEYIEYVLTQNDGNITKTAKALGLHRQSLQRKLKKKP